MKKSVSLLIGLFLLISTPVVFGEETIDTDCIQKSVDDNPTVRMEDLVRRDGLYFRKFTVCPFTGKVKEKRVRGLIHDGYKDGDWITFWDNGQLNSKGRWLSGVRQGPWVLYWDNGQLKSKGTWLSGVRQGSWVSYFSDGDLHQQGSFLNGEKHGSWKVYYDNPSDIIYEDGKFLSVPVESETNLYTVGQYENGKRVGRWIVYHENGKVGVEGTFNKNSKREGPWVYYYATGQVEMKGSYKDGKRVGDWIEPERQYSEIFDPKNLGQEND